MLKIFKPILYPTITVFLILELISCKPVETTSVISRNYSAITAYIDLFDVKDDKVKVEIKVESFDVDTISYFIPKIVPGTYQNNNYGKYIEDFKALDKEGNPLYVQKYGDNRWKINNVKELGSITYWVNDTFDTEDKHDIFSPTGTNISRNQNFILNLYAFVGYFSEMKENKYRLFIKHPKNLEASGSLEEITPETLVEKLHYDTDFFIFKRYADVADSPIMYSDPDRITFTINGIEILLSVYSPNKIHRASRLMQQMERVIRAQRNFLGNINSTKKYSILLYLSTSKKDDAQGFGALEHNTSTVVVLPESISVKKLNETLTDVVSHEFFHIVTPLTIHSKEIHDFDYNMPNMSKHLWLYEGTTEYFSILFQITQGLISKEQFFERILEKIEISKQFDDTMSFTTMSKNILEEPYRKNYRNVYEKGALISMCLDIIMREESDGVLGVLDLIKELSGEFGSETPFDDDELIDVVTELSYPEIGEFLKTHVVNNTPIDYSFYLNKVGLEFGTKDVLSSYFIDEQQPLVKASETTQEVVFESDTQHNSFLKSLGIMGGDVLLSINSKEYSVKNIYDLFADSNQWEMGAPIVFKIKRNGEEKVFNSTVQSPMIKKIILQPKPNSTDNQKSLLKYWIND